MKYDLESLDLPRLSGRALRTVVRVVETRVGRAMIATRLKRDGGMDRLHEIPVDGRPTFHPPLAPSPVRGGGNPRGSGDPRHAVDPHGEGEPSGTGVRQGAGVRHGTGDPHDTIPALRRTRNDGARWPPPGVDDFAHAYRSGSTTPEEVAERVITAIEMSDEGDRPMRAFISSNADDIRAQARASARRFREGVPLGPFDGVPVGVKDEVDQAGYPTTVGTKILAKGPALHDSAVVERMRAGGALLIGKTNMQEIGLGLTGANVHWGTVRNPYDPARHTGGSSSGSAAAVASGICPVAIAADGGGSLRVPAAFCGLTGLKPTYGRVSERGAAQLCWSLAHLGALAATTRDAALAYATLAGADERDPATLAQPRLRWDGVDNVDLTGIRLGVYRPWFNHADAPVVEACDRMLEAFGRSGAEIREVVIPGLDAARMGHAVTIMSEVMAAVGESYMRDPGAFSLDVRLTLGIARTFSARDYVQAQRLRTQTLAHFANAFELVDAVVTPASACIAPLISAAALGKGESDLALATEIMRFAIPANFTGHPAISFPAGHDAAGMPIGMQAIARPWEEHLLLRLAGAAEAVVDRVPPQVRFDVLC